MQQFLDFSHNEGVPPIKDYIPPRECHRGASSDFFDPINRFPVPKCNYDEFSAIQYFIFGNNYSTSNPTCSSFNIKCDNFDMDNTLVVHLRSGDVFSPGGGHENYKQPPVAFYQFIFRSRKWSKILFITSLEPPEHWNPVWTYFLNETNRLNSFIDPKAIVSFQMSSNVQEDLLKLWCARFYVAPFSTFSLMMIYIAPYLKEFYISGMGDCKSIDHSPSVTCHHLLLNNYHMFHSGKWSNSPEQREVMITFPLVDVTEDTTSH